MAQASGQADVIETVLGVRPAAAVTELRARRPEFVRHTQGGHDVLMRPADPGMLTPGERALIALTVATLAGHAGLAAHYRTLVERQDPALLGATQPPRLAALLDHVRRVTVAPASATSGDLDTLQRWGLGTRDIVTLTQIVAFASYQLRVAAGLALLAGEATP